MAIIICRVFWIKQPAWKRRRCNRIKIHSFFSPKKSIQRIIELFARHKDGLWFGNTQWCNQFLFCLWTFCTIIDTRSNNSSLCIVCPLCFHNYLFFFLFRQNGTLFGWIVDPLAMPNKNEQHFCTNSLSLSLNVIRFPKTQESNRNT